MLNQFFNPWWYLQIVYLPFVFALGSVVGSFLNVVILRLPAGQSITTPASHCPKCLRRLPWHENLPIVGWLLLRGRCRGCGNRISLQYPLIELFCACMFTAVFVEYFMIRPTAPFFGGLCPAYLSRLGVDQAWTLAVLHLILLSSLLAMSVIDVRTYMIPIELTLVVTISAFVIHAVMPIYPAGGVPPPLSSPGLAAWTIPLVGPQGFGAATGGMLGIAISSWLLRRSYLRPGFLDFDLFVKEDGDVTDYPFARRELQWELSFLTPIVLGVMLGWNVGSFWTGQPLSLWAAALGGSIMGYLMGAAIVWVVRIGATAAFGKEAMGLGDAHLLGCIGAVTGWVDPILIFLLAPFIALTMMLIGTVLGRFLRGFRRVLPFGPALALATVVVMFGDWWIEPLLSSLLGRRINLP